MFHRPKVFEALAFCLGAAALIAAPASGAVDYTREIKPLLREHCYKCHGSQQQKGELRVDTATFLRQGGENGAAFTPGRSAESLLLQAVHGTHDSISRMPYKKPPLDEAQIKLLARWIDEGASAPPDEAPESDLHWAFVLPARPAGPGSSESVISEADRRRSHTDLLNTDSLITNSPAFGGNPIDAFIHARLAQEKLKPSPEADRVTLIRRLSLDLIGLPPRPEEVADFVNDKSAHAYEQLVERLLASPHYGERWGRWWLDAARYADSNGYSIDAPRQIWKYRDWVITALNRDMPFDQFTLWQLAGDLLATNSLPAGTPSIEPLIATGFNRHTQINQEGGIDPEQFRVESVMDRVNTFSTVWLGLTVACAQCHDHKFDPISQREYYQLYAFFNNTVEDGHGKATPGGMLEIPGELDGDEAVAKELEEAREELDRYLNTRGSDVATWENGLNEEARGKLRSAVKNALRKPWSERSVEEKRAVYAAFKSDDPEFKSRNGKVTRLERNEPKPVTTLVMRELNKPRESHLFIKGDFTRPAEKVEPGVLAVLHPFNASSGKSDTARTNLNRLDLAHWVIDPANPLTARVIVNRVWQQYFGRGLVETENDFGTQGSPPTHPELLDWLALVFVDPRRSDIGKSAAKWSLKNLHRLIVTSATYRQSSRARPELESIDPLNKWLARQTRLRLDAEIVRDNALAASGLLSRKMGGPPVYPPQPEGVMSLGQIKRNWTPSAGEDRYRRAVYTHFWRATPHPALTVFDAPDAFSACTRRIRSNTPLQALTLLNDQQFVELADALAQRLLGTTSRNDKDRLTQAFRLCVAREPNATEQARLEQLLNEQIESEPGDAETKRRESWKTVARVLLNLDEMMTRE